MIALRRLNNEAIMVNPDLIESLEATPDTVVTLTSGNKLLVRDTMDESARRSSSSSAGSTAPKPASAEPPTQAVAAEGRGGALHAAQIRGRGRR